MKKIPLEKLQANNNTGIAFDDILVMAETIFP